MRPARRIARCSPGMNQQQMIDYQTRENKALIRELTEQRLAVNQQLAQNLPAAQHNQLVAMSNGLTDRLNLLIRQERRRRGQGRARRRHRPPPRGVHPGRARPPRPRRRGERVVQGPRRRPGREGGPRHPQRDRPRPSSPSARRRRSWRTSSCWRTPRSRCSPRTSRSARRGGSTGST